MLIFSSSKSLSLLGINKLKFYFSLTRLYHFKIINLFRMPEVATGLQAIHPNAKEVSKMNHRFNHLIFLTHPLFINWLIARRVVWECRTLICQLVEKSSGRSNLVLVSMRWYILGDLVRVGQIPWIVEHWGTEQSWCTSPQIRKGAAQVAILLMNTHGMPDTLDKLGFRICEHGGQGTI